MSDTTRLSLKEIMIFIVVFLLAALAIIFPDIASAIFWALCEGAAMVKG